jgi:hypothetical protein
MARRKLSRFERCVLDVKTAGGRARNPWAICRTSVRRKRRRSNPRTLPIVIAKGPSGRRLKYLKTGKFGEKGRVYYFRNAKEARALAISMLLKYPDAFRHYKVYVKTR